MADYTNWRRAVLRELKRHHRGTVPDLEDVRATAHSIANYLPTLEESAAVRAAFLRDRAKRRAAYLAGD